MPPVWRYLSIVQKLLPLTLPVLNAERQDKNPLHLAMWGGHRETFEYLKTAAPCLLEDFNYPLGGPHLDIVFQPDVLSSLEQRTDKSRPCSPHTTIGFHKVLEQAGRHHLGAKRYDLAFACFDLDLVLRLDSAQRRDIQKISHTNVYCDRCGIKPIGFLYRCAMCPPFDSFDLCTRCFQHKGHITHSHDQFIQIPSSFPLSSIEDLLEKLKKILNLRD